MLRHRVGSGVVAVAALVLACGGGGTVARFAPCSSTDTCPADTTCEAATSTTLGSATISGPTFCTWSCSPSDFGGQDCPSDANGIKGVCVSALGNTGVGDEDVYGFCFQDCSETGECPSSEACEQAQPFNGGTAMVCVPIATDPLSATTWTSTTLDPIAKSAGVTSSSYTIDFGAANMSVAGFASGPFTATLVQTYGASAVMYAGCMETTTFSGGQWVDVPPSGTTAGAVNVSNAQGTTSRAGCTFVSDDASGVMGVYDDAVNDMSGAVYRITGTTMMLAGGTGITPYTDSTEWTFTQSQ